MNFRRTFSVWAILALLFLLFSCRMDPGFGPGSPAKLPEDKVLDVARSYSGPFAYETVLPVALDLTVDLYRQPSPAAALERQAVDGQLIVISLWNAKGEALYSGAISSGGTLSTVLSLPAAPQDVVLRLESPGYQTREVKIGGMVLYSEVRRVMGLLTEGLSAKAVLPDADKDGVPDLYDVDPLDPEVAFQVRTPASGHFTVAFEDLFPVPGDADYNDFVASYFLVENYQSKIVQLSSGTSGEKDPVPIEVTLYNLHGEATANAKVAGYSHKFGLVVDFPGKSAVSVTRTYWDASGVQKTDTQADVADRAVIWLFENSSRNVVSQTATFDIVFPKGITRSMVSIAPYDPVLYVLNTSKDIHLVGQDSLSGQQISYMDPNGYPWGLLVPEDWQHPAETQYIGKAYPLFDEWRASKGAVAPYWYLFPASTGTAAGNRPPYPVTAPTANPQLVAGSPSSQEFQLSLTDPKADPDGDTVQFMSSPAPMALQDLFALDAGSGLVTFQHGVPAGDYLFYFWSVDEHGASTLTTPFKVIFSFVGKIATNNPPSATFNDPPITGSTAIGGTLTASYAFSDPDGDPEGTSLFQWYRFGNGTDVTGGEAIAEATAKSYTTGNADSGKWLRVQVTPMDAPVNLAPLAGTPVLSGPVRVNTRIVIDTFPATGSFQNDTYLTLIDGSGTVKAQDDNGFPDQANANLCSRIDVTAGLPAGKYYVKVHKPTELGSPNYGFRVLDYNPGASFPAVTAAGEMSDSDNGVDTNGVPTTPWPTNALGQVFSRSIYPELTDVDWFWFEIQ